MINRHIKLTIIDPDRWYLSYAKTRKHYLQIHSAIWSDPDFLALTPNAKLLFFWLKNASLRANNPSFSVCLNSALPIFNGNLEKINDLLELLRDLKANNIISLQTKLNPSIKENRIEENKIKAKQSFASDSFDIDAIYNSYPKKQGKAPGIKKLRTLIKDKETYDKVMQGVKSYADYCDKNKVEKQFIKQFSTWVNQECWLDDYTEKEADVYDPFAELRNKPEYKNEV